MLLFRIFEGRKCKSIKGINRMHEFSLAAEVIKLVQSEAEKNNAIMVSEITIEAGNFCGVEAVAFESALTLLMEGTILEKARLNLIKTRGKGFCQACGSEFEIDQRFDPCPVCNSFPSEIRGGNEFRVVSLIIEKD